MKPTRFLCAAMIPLCVLALGLFCLSDSASADLNNDKPALAIKATNPEPRVSAIDPWPPFHQDLSRSEDRDSGGADVDAAADRIAVVWAEGSSAQGLNDGRVKLAWKPSRDQPWRTRVVPQQLDGFAHYQPAVAIKGLIAHVVWVREDIEGTAKGNNRISYSRCHLDTGVCTSPVGVSPEDAAYSRLAPDIAVDANGTPHVVWVRQNHQQIGRILYNNYTDGAWNTPEVVSGGSSVCAFSQDNPAIAVDDSRVHVVWDENVEQCTDGGTAGIYYRQRKPITRPSGTGDWRPRGIPWGKQLSVPHAETRAKPSEIDGFPTLDAASGRVYVMWERFVQSQTLPFYGAVYTYSLPYRVYAGIRPDNDWWPGGLAADRWAVLPFTSTSATDRADYYEGVRPSIEQVGPVPHVVWHHWEPPSLAQLAELDPQAELPDEYLVDNASPYRVSYATYRPGTDPWDLKSASSKWFSETVYAMDSDRIHASPDLAFSTMDNGKTYQLHIALHQRGAYVQSDSSFGWDVWYTNDKTFYRGYIPFLVQPHP